ncbi:Alpha-ketoglutarate-dependent dioxygenase alkB 7, mitochondrial, partial [Cladochytrium tenue]
MQTVSPASDAAYVPRVLCGPSPVPGAGAGPFVFGGSTSYNIYQSSKKSKASKLLQATPRVLGLCEAVHAHPGVAAYLSSSRRIPFNEDGIFHHYAELELPPVVSTGPPSPSAPLVPSLVDASCLAPEHRAVLDNLFICPDFLRSDEQQALADACLKKLRRLARGYREASVSAWGQLAFAQFLKGGSQAIDPAEAEAIKLVERVRVAIGGEMERVGEPVQDWLDPHLLELRDGNSGIGAHVDNLQASGQVIAGMCLLSPAVLVFRHAQQRDSAFSVLAEPGTLYMQRGRLRYEFTHEIPMRPEDHVFNGRPVARSRRVVVLLRDRRNGASGAGLSGGGASTGSPCSASRSNASGSPRREGRFKQKVSDDCKTAKDALAKSTPEFRARYDAFVALMEEEALFEENLRLLISILPSCIEEHDEADAFIKAVEDIRCTCQVVLGAALRLFHELLARPLFYRYFLHAVAVTSSDEHVQFPMSTIKPIVTRALRILELQDEDTFEDIARMEKSFDCSKCQSIDISDKKFKFASCQLTRPSNLAGVPIPLPPCRMGEISGLEVMWMGKKHISDKCVAKEPLTVTVLSNSVIVARKEPYGHRMILLYPPVWLGNVSARVNDTIKGLGLLVEIKLEKMLLILQVKGAEEARFLGKYLNVRDLEIETSTPPLPRKVQPAAAKSVDVKYKALCKPFRKKDESWEPLPKSDLVVSTVTEDNLITTTSLAVTMEGTGRSVFVSSLPLGTILTCPDEKSIIVAGISSTTGMGVYLVRVKDKTGRDQLLGAIKEAHRSQVALLFKKHETLLLDYVSPQPTPEIDGATTAELVVDSARYDRGTGREGEPVDFGPAYLAVVAKPATASADAVDDQFELVHLKLTSSTDPNVVLARLQLYRDEFVYEQQATSLAFRVVRDPSLSATVLQPESLDGMSRFVLKIADPAKHHGQLQQILSLLSALPQRPAPPPPPPTAVVSVAAAVAAVVGHESAITVAADLPPSYSPRSVSHQLQTINDNPATAATADAQTPPTGWFGAGWVKSRVAYLNECARRSVQPSPRQKRPVAPPPPRAILLKGTPTTAAALSETKTRLRHLSATDDDASAAARSRSVPTTVFTGTAAGAVSPTSPPLTSSPTVSPGATQPRHTPLEPCRPAPAPPSVTRGRPAPSILTEAVRSALQFVPGGAAGPAASTTPTSAATGVATAGSTDSNAATPAARLRHALLDPRTDGSAPRYWSGDADRRGLHFPPVGSPPALARCWMRLPYAAQVILAKEASPELTAVAVALLEEEQAGGASFLAPSPVVRRNSAAGSVSG